MLPSDFSGALQSLGWHNHLDSRLPELLFKPQSRRPGVEIQILSLIVIFDGSHGHGGPAVVIEQGEPPRKALFPADAVRAVFLISASDFLAALHAGWGRYK